MEAAAADRQPDIPPSAWAAASALSELTVHAAWAAANARTLQWGASHRDAQRAKEVALQLEALLPEGAAPAVVQLSLAAAWYASNTRRLLLFDAARDLRKLEEAAAELAKVMPPETAKSVKALATSAAWHAANARSMLWLDAERDLTRFEECCRQLPALLQGVTDGAAAETPADASRVRRRRRARARLERLDGPSPFCRRGQAGPRATSPRATSPRGTSPRAASAGAAASVGAGEGGASLLQRSGREALRRLDCALDDVAPLWAALDPAALRRGDDGGAEGEGEASCEALLAAVYATVAVLDHLGATFAPVARELRKNADKLAAAARRLSPERTLRALVAREVREGACVRGEAAKEGSAALALLWLCRLLRMLHDALARVGAEGGAVLAECLHAAYDATLRPHQDPFTRRVVAAAIWAAPSRADFLARLGSHREGVEAAVVEMAARMETALRDVHALLHEAGVLGAEPLPLPERGD